jgi:hypothetical protein
MEWQPLASKLVAEVEFDHFTGGRFRHGTRFLRWRPEKAPRDCTMGQVKRENRSALGLLSAQRNERRGKDAKGKQARAQEERSWRHARM